MTDAPDRVYASPPPGSPSDRGCGSSPSSSPGSARGSRSWSPRRSCPASRSRASGARCSSRSIVAVLNAVIPPLLAALRLPLTLVLGFLLVLVADAADAPARRRPADGVLTVDYFGWALLAALVVAAVSVVLAVVPRQRRRHVHRSGSRSGSRAGRGSSPAPTCRGSSTSRSTGSRCPCCGARCATATRRTWRAGSPTARTGWPSGRPTSRRRPAPARRASCSARTRTSPRSAGSRRRRRR